MAYKKCRHCNLTLDLNNEYDDDHEVECPGRPVIGHTPAGEVILEGDSVCDSCGNKAHTEAELAACMDSMLAPVETEDND